jgi:hypothetical protein
MKKLLGFSFSILILFSSCATVNQPKFKNNTNHKELILSKYGESTIVKNDDNYETWVYDYGSFLKSNRNVIFNKENRIVSNKKILSPPAYLFRNIVAPVVILALIVGGTASGGGGVPIF